MEDLPEGFDEDRLRAGLRGFGLHATTIGYAPVGFGDYHWTVTDAAGERWFATVADLDHKEHCGQGAVAALAGLRRAMETAAVLRERDGLSFVVAPLRAPSGETVVPLDARYGLSVFPYLPGTAGEFGQEQTPEERGMVLDLLADLHSRTPPEPVPAIAPALPGRAGLEAALSEAATTWRGGPFSEPARGLVAAHATALRARLRDFDRLDGDVRGRGAALVVTHGEPHPGNLLLGDGGYLLVDWDTVGLAVPERDLSVVSADPAAFARYTETTGHAVDPAAVELYRLRWALSDVADFAAWFRAPHTRNPDTETAWQGLTRTVEHLAGGSAGPR
ncbi:phosphotransferase [Nonomuraea sp. LPB2021202275-12-8]|uniref:phosphotransferase n=1 Tax=Nonomuraea sp. LPB2021202275-12-8 TaxID=3120159 RepID=UPI00300CCCEF